MKNSSLFGRQEHWQNANLCLGGTGSLGIFYDLAQMSSYSPFIKIAKSQNILVVFNSHSKSKPFSCRLKVFCICVFFEA